MKISDTKLYSNLRKFLHSVLKYRQLHHFFDLIFLQPPFAKHLWDRWQELRNKWVIDGKTRLSAFSCDGKQLASAMATVENRFYEIFSKVKHRLGCSLKIHQLTTTSYKQIWILNMHMLPQLKLKKFSTYVFQETMFLLLILSLCAKRFVVFNTSELVSHEPMVTTTSEKTVHNVTMTIFNANIIQ